jgi:hypothetical protein
MVRIIEACWAKGSVMKVEVAWDSEAQVWTVTDSAVPGLVAECATVEGLCLRLQSLIPEVLAANGLDTGSVASVELLARRRLTVLAPATIPPSAQDRR